MVQKNLMPHELDVEFFFFNTKSNPSPKINFSGETKKLPYLVISRSQTLHKNNAGLWYCLYILINYSNEPNVL
jgi:hypothetical protein